MDTTTDTSSDEAYKTTKKRGTYSCTYEGCTATFSKNSKLTYHIRRHTGERPFACDVPNCNKTYLYSFHLRRHKEVYHGNRTIERIICSAEGCYLELANKYSLKKHIKLKHNPEKSYPFNCVECKQGFHRKRQLMQHSYVHTGVFPFKCEICENGFPTLRDCNRHKRTHTSYFCKCGRSFERWTLLMAHKRLCETVRPKCNTCNKTFTQRSNLKKHLELHLTENVEVYACGYNDCTRSYLYKKNLLYHINKCHRKIALPKIACTEPGCKRAFSRRQNLQHHLMLCHSKDILTVNKAVRKPRRDKGISKTSTAAVLAGLKLPPKLHCTAIQGLPIELPKSAACASNDTKKTRNSSEENVNASREAVLMLKDQLKQALLTNLNSNKSKNCDTDDNINKPCLEVLC